VTAENRVDNTKFYEVYKHAKTGGYCSQEVGHYVTVVNDSGAFSDGVEDLEVVLDILVNLHDGGHVSTSVTIVRSRPYGDEVRILEPEFKSVHDKLMGTSNQIQSVNMVEF
jgi:hypothetical protein|tara:strand:- start:328 stop:660 length:333 start_codon:yes stop_codon:yes gene_type:complete